MPRDRRVDFLVRVCDCSGRMLLKACLLTENIGKEMKNKPIVKISCQFLEGIIIHKGQISGMQHIMLVLSDFWLEDV